MYISSYRALPMAQSLRGLGDAAQYVQQTAGAATPVVATAAAGSVSSILGVSAAVAVPLIGAAIFGVTLAITALLRRACGKTCVVTSEWANQAEPILADNIRAYFGTAAPRSRSQQAAALANFDAVWAQLQQLCSQPGLGPAGQNCIGDRQRGACKWRQTADSPLLAYPGQPQPGECWNWFSGYRDPIANDTRVVDDAELALSSAGAEISSAVASVGGVPSLFLAVGLIAVVWGVSQS